MRIGTATDVVRALQLARGTRRSDGDADRPWGGIVLMIGAGCSKSAGVPLGVEIAREQVLALARAYSNEEFASDDPEAAKTWLHQNLPETFPATSTWSDLYGRIFEYHVCDYVQQGAVIRNAIARAKGLNWAHVCLGELVRHHYVHTILTTNFDGLALAGIIRSGLLPIVADGIGALTRIDGRPTHPQLVQLHGSGQAYRLRNSVSDIAALESDGAVIRSIGDLLRDSPALVVAGYAGEERGVMEVMRKATAEFGRKSIFWVQYDPNPDRLASAPRHLLENGGTLIVGQDADVFFAELMRGLNHAIPDWMRDPTGALEYGLQEVIAPSKSPLIRELDTYRDRIAALVAADRQWVLDRSDLERRLSRFREQVHLRTVPRSGRDDSTEDRTAR